MTTSAKRSGLSRAVIACHEENLDSALKAYAETFGISDFDEPFVVAGMGLKASVSWQSGMELIAPHGTEGIADSLRAHLAERGEGVIGLVYEVPNLAEAEARAAAAGHAPPRGEHIDCLASQPAWKSLFSLAQEAPLQPLAGVQVTLIQLDRT